MSPTPPPHPLAVLFRRNGWTLTQVAQATGERYAAISAMAHDQRTMSRRLLDGLRRLDVDVDGLLADVALWRMERMQEANEALAELAKVADR